MVGHSAEDDSPARTPFPAIVGQQDLKRVLLATAVNDDLDGALITGEKGTAKSTAVRALVDLLPEQRAVADCPYGCPPGEPAAQCEECRQRRADGEELPVETRPVPLVTLPLGATRDRVVGTLSVSDALAGDASFDPGLLARANRGFLYVDEVNLLDDHLVDVVLDAAASGTNVVERDGVSVAHPADVTLIGTMNPEEGDLRPQLRDRFALQATVTGSEDLDERVEIIDRALERSDRGSAFASEYADDVERLRERIATAREDVSAVTLPEAFRVEIAELCRDAGVDGHRGDIATARTALTFAALDGRGTVIESDVAEAVSYTLPHRLRSRPFEDAPTLEEVLEDRLDDANDGGERADDGGDQDRDGEGDPTDDAESEGDGESGDSGDAGTAGPDDGERGGRCADGTGDRSDDPSGESERDDSRSGDPESDSGDRTDPDSDLTNPQSPPGGGTTPGESGGAEGSSADAADGSDDDTGSDGPGDGGGEGGSDDDPDSEEATPLVPGQRRAPGEVAEIGHARAPALEPSTEFGAETGDDGGGDRVGTTSPGGRGSRVRTEPADPGDAVDAAASVRAAATRGDSRVEREDLRRTVTTDRGTATIVFAVDASASMRPAMRAAKGVVLDLLRDSYQRRDEVAVVAFAGTDAEELLPPTDSVTLAARHLKELPSGDRTPLPAGVERATDVVRRVEADAAAVVVVTDGRATVADGSPTEATRRAARELAATGASVLVVDAGDGGRAGLSKLLATEAGGERVPLDSLTHERVREVVE